MLVAYFLRRAGFPVTVIERDDVGGGASGATVPWVNASGKRPREYFDLCVESMRLWAQVSAECSGGGWYQQTGNLHWAVDERVQRRLEERACELRAWGYESRLLAIEEAASLEPGQDLRSAIGPAVFYPQEAVLHPRRMLLDLKARTAAADVAWRVGSPVVDFGWRGDRIIDVVLGTGERVAVSGVIVCAGLGTNEVLEHLGVRLRMVEHDELGRITSPEHTTYVTAHGLLVELEQNSTHIGRIVHAPGITLFPAERGGIVLHSPASNERVNLRTPMEPVPPVAHKVLEQAAQAVPSLTGARVRRTVLGKRPIPLDELPAVGRVPVAENCHVMVSHSAMTTGPALAAAMTRSLEGGDPVPASFEAARLLVDAA